MDKIYYLFPILIFCSFSQQVRGQKALDETIQKIVSLEEDIVILEKDSLKIENEKKNLLLQIEKDSIKNKELERTYNSLIATTSQDSILILRQYVDSLEKQQKLLQASIYSIKKDINEKSKELRDADSELQDMGIYSEIQKRHSYESNKLYLNKKYSSMSLDKLTEISNSIDEYKSQEGFTDYKKRVVVALNNKKLFDNVWECLSKGNGYQNVDQLRIEINNLLEIRKDDPNKGIYKLTKEQFNEIDSLDIKLSRYNNGIKELQKIIARINADEQIVQIRNARTSGSKKECIEIMRKYVIPQEGGEVARICERYFKMIPYLEKLLREYWDELNKNPFNSPTKTEKTINNLVVK